MLSLLRSQEIFNPREHGTPVTIIGAGAIGSRVFAHLFELGLSDITVYDDDIVEAHNCNNQQFFASQVGSLKTEALSEWAECKADAQLPLTYHFVPERVTPATEVKGTVFLLVDSLETRRELFASFKGNYHIPRVIDVRMAASHGSVYCVSPHSDQDAYLATLGSDDEAEVSACGSPFSVSPTAGFLSSLAVWQYINAVKDNSAEPRIDVFLNPLIVTPKSL